jgi:hypothetical protein
VRREKKSGNEWEEEAVWSCGVAKEKTKSVLVMMEKNAIKKDGSRGGCVFLVMMVIGEGKECWEEERGEDEDVKIKRRHKSFCLSSMKMMMMMMKMKKFSFWEEVVRVLLS